MPDSSRIRQQLSAQFREALARMNGLRTAVKGVTDDMRALAKRATALRDKKKIDDIRQDIGKM